MRPLLLRLPLGCLDTVFGSFRASRNKLVTQAAAVPHLYYFRKTMHYQTEERGRPHSPDYRIYFSKLLSSPPWGRTNACPIHFVVFQHTLCDRYPAGQGLTFELHVQGCYCLVALLALSFGVKPPLKCSTIVPRLLKWCISRKARKMFLFRSGTHPHVVFTSCLGCHVDNS